MSNNLIYGLMIDGNFYSNRMSFPLNHPNGIYSMDMSQDDFRSTITPADIDEAVKFFRKSSKIKVVRGISFHDGLIPENPINFKSIPIHVKEATYDEFEEVEAVSVQDGPYYFLRIISTEKSFPLLEIREALENRTNIEAIKGVTPEIRITYTFHFIEMEKERLERERAEQEARLKKEREEMAERRKKEMEQPTGYIRAVMEESGAVVRSVRKVNRGYEVVWTAVGYTINTLLGNDFRVIEAGFCTSGNDYTQSASSVAKLLKDYVDEDQHFVITRTSR